RAAHPRTARTAHGRRRSHGSRDCARGATVSEGRLTPPVTEERDHVRGSVNAPVTLVEYGDYECPYCGMAYPIVKSIQRRLGSHLRFVFRNFPLKESHPHAQHAAEAAEAVAGYGGARAFWGMHDAMYEHQDALADADLVYYASRLGLDGEQLAKDLAAGTFAKR